MRHDTTGSSDIRLAELMAALSLATDLGMGQPLEYALCACVLAVRLGEAVGLDEGGLRAVYYQALLRYIGCNAEAYAMAALSGDELALRQDVATVDQGSRAQLTGLVFRSVRRADEGAAAVQLGGLVAQGLMPAPGVFKEQFGGHCEVAQRLAEGLGFVAPIVAAV